jgi:hypothetical protein
MATAAYVVLDDDSFDLAVDGPNIDVDHTINFGAPNVDGGKEAVLSFDANPGETDVSIEWKLNGTNFLNQTFNTGDARAWQRVVPKNLLKATDNKLTARLTDTDGSGSINLRDIVLLYTQKP